MKGRAALALYWMMMAVRRGGWGRRPPISRLRQHLYAQQPPHNPALYQILQVPGNATTWHIQRSYRTLSRLYHPDKQQHHSHSQAELERVRMAYEILKDDTKRFLYHRHGVHVNTPHYPNDLLYILYPTRQRHVSGPYDAAAIRELHRYMGWNDAMDRSSSTITKEERIQNIVWHLAEQMRPILESQDRYNQTLQHVLTDLAQHCDRCKYLPFGAGILRCIGRAYQYEGRRALRRRRGAALRAALRQLGHWSTAALAGSRVLLLPPTRPKRSDRIDTDRLLNVQEEDEDEAAKAATAYLESLQMDALWKVYKMELDDIIRQACREVLQSRPLLPSYLSDHDTGAEMVHGYIPSSTSNNPHHPSTIVWTHALRSSMAHILIRMGQVMVERSKVGTAWRA